MLVENGKLNNLVEAIKRVKQTPGLLYSNVFTFAKISQFGEASLKPFIETVKAIQKAHIVKWEDGKPEMQPNGQPKVDDFTAMSEEAEEASKEKVEFVMDSCEISVKKDDTRLTVDLLKAFLDVFGEALKVTEIA